jgi:hypothetical protein
MRREEINMDGQDGQDREAGMRDKGEGMNERGLVCSSSLIPSPSSLSFLLSISVEKFLSDCPTLDRSEELASEETC